MVYTPEAVVSGIVHTNARSEDTIERAIAQTAKQFAASRVPISLLLENGQLLIDVAAAPKRAQAKEATVWLAAIASSIEVPIARGENKGRTIVYSNVVRRLMPVGTWSGAEMVVKLDRNSFMTSGTDRCAVLLQQGHGGPIIGAALLVGI
jgi:hypothetical protein